jgi:hypothetical protein
MTESRAAMAQFNADTRAALMKGRVFIKIEDVK